MTFSNPILAGETLVRASIESEGFTAGSQGWSIQRDGDAEFNDVTIRGSWEVSGPSGRIHAENGIITVYDPSDNVVAEFSADGFSTYDLSTTPDSGARLVGSSLEFVDDITTGDVTTFLHDGELGFLDATGASLTRIRRVTSVTHEGKFSINKHLMFDVAGSVEDWREIGSGGNPAFVNSFSNFGGAFETVAFKLMPDGTVQFKGTGTRTGDTPDNTSMFTLPAGFRPGQTVIMPIANASNISGSVTGPAIRVDSAGVVTLWGFSNVATNTSFALDGARFSII
jgi:hypothetical protein